MNSHWRHPSDPTPFKLKTRRQAAIENALIALGCLIASILLVAAFMWSTGVFAAEIPKATIECPNPGEACKIVVLTPQEEAILTRQGGILDTAASARFLDLGNPVSYFRMKLLQAPAGDVKPVEKPKSETKPAEGSSTDK